MKAHLLLVGLASLIFCGCASDHEHHARHKSKHDSDYKVQNKYSGCTTAQLQLERQQVAASIPAWHWGYGIMGAIQESKIASRQQELADIDRELLRRAESGDTTAQNKISFLVVSDPPGAKIEVDGRFFGVAPRVIEGSADVTTVSTIQATPAPLDVPVLGFFTGYTNTGSRISADLSCMGWVALVFPNTPASQMGMLNEDRIVAVNGVALPEVTGSKQSAEAWIAAFRSELSGAGFGSHVAIKVIRNGQEKELHGQTSEQVEGAYYVQQKVMRPLTFNNQIILFDMRTPNAMPIVVGGAGSASVSRKGGTTTGTGFVVAEGGYILTCHHVIAKSEDIEVRDQTGEKYRAKVIASDAGNDLCLLQAVNLAIKPIPSAPPNSVSAGETVFCLGYPMEGVLENSKPVAGTGVIASLRGLKGDPRHLQVTLPVNPGNSGGPVLDVHGRWIAVASHKLSDLYSLAATGQTPQGINFAVKGSLVVPLFDSIPEVKLPVVEANDKLSLEEVTKQLSGAVVSISAKH
jgi:S1-C subfamily serine protease